MKKSNTIHRPKRKSFIAQLILVLLGVELLFFSAFTAFNLPTATGRNLQYYCLNKLRKAFYKLPPKWQEKMQMELPGILKPILKPILSADPNTLPSVRYSLYVPQVPITIFIGYVLGWPLALITLLIYILLGVLGPLVKIYPLAAGGNMNYYLQPSFGYLAGMIIAAAVVAYFSRGERTSTKQLLSLLTGLACIHGAGLLYMLGLCLFGALHDATGAQLPWSVWVFEEARNLTWYVLPYDLLFSLALIGIGFPFRWLVSTLVAPDIAVREGNTQNNNLINFHPATR